MEKTRRRQRRDAGGGSAPVNPATGKVARCTVYTLSEDETAELGQAVSRGLRGGELVLLVGDLGLGKTVLARGIAGGLGVAPEDVHSPSFLLVQEYCGGRVPMFHVDLFRLEEPEEVESLGIREILSSGAVVVVEWGDRLPPAYTREAITIRMFDMGEGSRRIELDPKNNDVEGRRGDA